MAAPVGDVTMPMRCGMAGRGSLRSSSNSPSWKQPLLQLLEGDLQRADALWIDRFGDQLVVAARLVDAQAPARDHLHARLRRERQLPHGRPKHDRAQLAFGVFEREVGVAALHQAQVGDLALDPHQGVGILQKLLDFLGDLADREDAPKERFSRRRLQGQTSLSRCLGFVRDALYSKSPPLQRAGRPSQALRAPPRAVRLPHPPPDRQPCLEQGAPAR